MRIIAVNVNTSESMTRAIAESARRYASAGTDIVALQPFFGAEAVDCAFESYLSAVAVMDRVVAYRDPFDAVVLAGFGEHGRDGLQELIDQPVIEICEASAHVAMMIGRAYSVVTTLQRSVPAIEDRLALAGLAERCASVRASGMSTLEVDRDPEAAILAVVDEARKAVHLDHAEVICLGCAGMAGLEEAITSELGVPVIDGVGAAVRLAEAVVGLGLRTSKVSTYAPPDPKQIIAWPLSEALGMHAVRRRPVSRGSKVSTDLDLASRWLGGSVIAASDESFGEKENLVVPAAAAFEPGSYGHRGEIVDGWETRRRREPGHDWAIVRLGAPGAIDSVDVDTSFFTGNFPTDCVVEACGVEGYPSPAELLDPATDWAEIVPRSPLRGDVHNTFSVTDQHRFTHVRLSVFPDGGVARLRVFGQVIPDPRGLEQLSVDLASQELGGVVTASSDSFYNSASLLNRPDTARTMGEGWETRRRRDSGHDFAVFRLAFAGRVRQLIVDTAHFKYNASAEVAAYGCGDASPPSTESPSWQPLLPRTRLQPDTRHVLRVSSAEPVAAIRLDAFPDGGLSRVRVIGTISAESRRQAGYRWLNSLPSSQARRCLADAGLDPDLAAELAGQRPLAGTWLDDRRAHLEPESFKALAGILHGSDD